MDTVTLGRTGLEVSVVALGAGGHSRLGLRKGATEAQAVAIVQAAVDRGITIIDTAPSYGTENVVGTALVGKRHGLTISSKVRPTPVNSAYDSMEFITAAELRSSVETSLKSLKTDHIDILHMHGVRPQQYDYCLSHLVPEMQSLQAQGKIRFLGITEGFGTDTEHDVMQRAIRDGIWDVLMLGYNFVNPSAAELVLPKAKANQLGVMCMYAVRGALAQSDTLQALIKKLVAQGEIDPAILEDNDPTEFLQENGVANSLTEAAYRFCRHTPGIDVVMTGTGNIDHLEQNIRAIQQGPLPANTLKRLAEVFHRVRTATGDPESGAPSSRA